MAAHKYWRWRCTHTSQGTNEFSAAEIYFNVTAFGVDQCLTVGGTPISSSNWDGSMLPPTAFDRNPSTVWGSTTYQASNWIGFNFNSPVEVNAVGRKSRPDDYWSPWIQNPIDSFIQSSDDGVTWNDEWSFSEAQSYNVWPGGELRWFTRPPAAPTEEHLYWRVRIARSWTGAIGLGTVEMRTTPGGPTACVGGMGYAGSRYGLDYDGSKAFDGDEGTFWANNNEAHDHIVYLFPSPVKIVEVALKSRPDGSQLQSPQDADVQWSDDGVTWTTSWAFRSLDQWTVNEQRVFTKPSLGGTGRYWRVRSDTILMQNGNTNWAIAELQLRSTSGGLNEVFTEFNAFASSEASGVYPARMAFNGNLHGETSFPNAPWASAGDAQPWLAYDFQGPRRIVEIAIYDRSDEYYSQATSAFYVECSNDSVNWDPIVKHSGITWTESDFDNPVPRTFYVQAAPRVTRRPLILI